MQNDISFVPFNEYMQFPLHVAFRCPKHQAKYNVYLIGDSIRCCLKARDISLDPADVNMHDFGIKLFIDSHINESPLILFQCRTLYWFFAICLSSNSGIGSYFDFVSRRTNTTNAHKGLLVAYAVLYLISIHAISILPILFAGEHHQCKQRTINLKF